MFHVKHFYYMALTFTTSYDVLTDSNLVMSTATATGSYSNPSNPFLNNMSGVVAGTLGFTIPTIASGDPPTLLKKFKNGTYINYEYESPYPMIVFRNKDGTGLGFFRQVFGNSPRTFYIAIGLDTVSGKKPLIYITYYNGRYDGCSAGYYDEMRNDFGTMILDGSEQTPDPYQFAPESEPDGGYGDFDYKSDAIPLPSAPSISVSDSGFVTLYKPTLAQLQSLAAYMWSGLFDMATFRKIFADPMDCIISLALMPVNPTASGSQELKVGNIGTGITIDKISTQFVEVSFNSLNIGLRANSFMDYSPYTKAQIYLPFIGTRSLSIDDIAGKNITLKYIIDVFTGACNASLGVEVTAKDGTTKTTTLYQFTGNVLANVPVTANNFASFLQATIGAVSTAVGVATGAGALPAIASAVNAATSMKPDIEKSGNLSATAGFLGVQKPYLILTYPNLCRPEGRDKVTGTPSFLGLSSNKKLSAFHGFTQLHRVNVQGISCTETERQMILSQLTGEGVILP